MFEFLEDVFDNFNYVAAGFALLSAAGTAYMVFQSGTENIGMFWKITSIVIVPIVIYFLVNKRMDN